MPNPPTGDEKFVVCIEFDGPLTDEQYDQIRKDLKQCVNKTQGKITDNRVAEK